METEIPYHTKTAAERQAAWRKRQAREGLKQVTGWVHEHQRAQVLQLINMLQQHPGLEVGPARHIMTGRLQKLRY